jgi:hypothetical protein
MPDWASGVIANRQHFRNAVLLLNHGPQDQSFWKVVYAVQSPFYLAVSKLRLLEEFRPVGSLRTIGLRPWEQFALHCNFAANCSAADMPAISDNGIFVIPEAFHRGQSRITSLYHPEPLAKFLLTLPAPERSEPKAKSARKSKEDKEDLVLAFPWLAELDLREGFSKGSSTQSSKGESSQKHQESFCLEERDALQIEAFMKSLDEARAALVLDKALPASDDFKVCLLGGKWTMEHKHTAYDALQGSARGALAKDFCRKRELQMSMRFDVSAYGEATCQILARAWCHRLQYFLDQEVAHPDFQGKDFPADVVAAYQEASEFSKLASSGAGKALQRRIDQIRAQLAS